MTAAPFAPPSPVYATGNDHRKFKINSLDFLSNLQSTCSLFTNRTRFNYKIIFFKTFNGQTVIHAASNFSFTYMANLLHNTKYNIIRAQPFCSMVVELWPPEIREKKPSSVHLKLQRKSLPVWTLMWLAGKFQVPAIMIIRRIIIALLLYNILLLLLQ